VVAPWAAARDKVPSSRSFPKEHAKISTTVAIRMPLASQLVGADAVFTALNMQLN